MALSRTRRHGGVDYWPGFVDALSTLVLAVIFLLSMFAMIQFFLSQELTGQDTALQKLTARIAQLSDLLALEKSESLSLEEQVAQLRASLAGAEDERDRFRGLYDGLQSGSATARGQVSELSTKLDTEKQATLRALAQVEVLNQQLVALRRQLAALEQALDVTEKRDRESQTRIAELGQRLNVALAQRVQELSRYRSDFFGRLRTILGDRPGIRIVGDRFVLQSEVIFDSARAELTDRGREEIDKIAVALAELVKEIPNDIPWVLRVDGHTDIRPISGGTFRSNWDLSAARAISVVQHLVTLGIPPERLLAAGFGEFQPLDAEKSDEAFARNRRIELKLTER